MVSPIYAGLLTILLLVLSVRVISGRFKHRVSVGDGGEKDLIKRMRVQANWIEYTPVALLLLLMLELQGASAAWLHISGLALLVGRLAHAYGFGHTPQIVPLRRFGVGLTFASLALLAILNVLFAIGGTN